MPKFEDRKNEELFQKWCLNQLEINKRKSYCQLKHERSGRELPRGRNSGIGSQDPFNFDADPFNFNADPDPFNFNMTRIHLILM